MRKGRLLVFWAWLSLLFAGMPGFAWAGEDSPYYRTTIEQSKQEGVSLLNANKGEEAYALYIRLLREQPEDPVVNLGLARAAMMSGRYTRAIMAYERLIERYPSQPEFYTEISAAYMALGDRMMAETYASRVPELDGVSTPEKITESLNSLEHRYNRFQVHGKVSTGALYDSNANQGPSSNVLSFGSWSNVIVPEAKKRETFGLYAGANLDLAWRLSQVSPWWLVGDTQGYWRGNENSELDSNKSREMQWGRAAAGFRRLSSETLLDVRAKAEIYDYEFDQNISAIGPETTFVWALSPDFHLLSTGGIDHRIYNYEADRNGTYGWAGEYLRYYFSKDRHHILLGARYTGGWAKEKGYGYDGCEGSAGIHFKLPYEVDIEPSIKYSEEFYRGKASILEDDDRIDRRWRMGLSGVWRFAEDWAFETTYYYTDNDSNSPLYNYTQNMVTMGVAWTF